MSSTPLSIDAFAQQIKDKYPDYAQWDNQHLTSEILKKYPEYTQWVTQAPQPPQLPMGTGEGPIAQGMTSFETQLSNLPRNLWQQSFLGEIGNPQVKAAHEARDLAIQKAVQQPGIIPGIKAVAPMANPIAKTDAGTPAERVDVGATAANLLPYLLAAKAAPTGALTSPVRAAVRGTNKVLQNYPKTAGAALGGAAGAATHVPFAREIGAGLGAAIGSEVLPKVRVPGEGFGLPNRVTGGPSNAPHYIAPSKVTTAAPEAGPVSLNRLTSDIQSLGYSKADALIRAKAGIAKYPNDLNAATTEAMRSNAVQQAKAPLSPPSSRTQQVVAAKAVQSTPAASATPTQQPKAPATKYEVAPPSKSLRIEGKDVPANTDLTSALQKSLPQGRIQGKIMQIVRREGTLGMDRLMEATELQGLSREQVEAAAMNLGKSKKLWVPTKEADAHGPAGIISLAIRKP